MKKFLRQALLSASFCVLTAGIAAAQAARDGKNEFSVWGGFSPASSTLIRGTGRTPDARLGTFNVRYARRFNNSDTVNLKYTLDFTPAAVLNFPDRAYVRTGANSYRVVGAMRSTRYAFGASPLGLELHFRPRKKIEPFVDGTGGVLFFDKDVPTFTGKRLGFTADIGGGIEYKYKEGKSVTFGYKYFHISNADRGLENPGFDNNLFYIGYTFRKK